MKWTGKKLWILIGLAAVAAAVFLDWQDVKAVGEKSSTPVVQPADRKEHRPKKDATMVAEVRLDKLGGRAKGEAETVDVFHSKTWFVPPPPPPPQKPVPPPPPPPPTAPPLPYTFLGSYTGTDGKLIIFLTRGDRVLSVSPGEILEGTYRVEGVTAGQLSLTYLPLNIKQSMNTGESS